MRELTFRIGGLKISIDSTTMGAKVVGGDETAHPFDVTFPIHTDRLHVSTRFQATGIGYAAVNSFTDKDIRDKGRRSLPTKTI